MTGLECDRLLNQRRRQGQVPVAFGDHPAEMPGLDMAGLDAAQSSANHAGLLQAPGPKMAECFGKCRVGHAPRLPNRWNLDFAGAGRACKAWPLPHRVPDRGGIAIEPAGWVA